jgi:penicillin amidase
MPLLVSVFHLRRVAIGITALLGAACAVLVWQLCASLPRRSGVVSVAGLEGALDVVRDVHGVPHVYAASALDAHFALGYVHAQERLWQLELGRRLAAGRLSEIFGPDALEQDRMFRTLGLAHVARQNEAHLDAGARAVLDAYVRGVNAFSSTHPTLPPEFLVFGVEPEPWTATDSILILKLMAWTLSGNLDAELDRLRLSGTLESRQIAELLGPDPSQLDLPIGAGRATFGAWQPAARDLWGRLVRRSEGLGSNNWVVDGSRSETGKPLLANDPHLELSAPASWYLAHLQAPGLDVIGASLPGIPGIILGQNGRVAWAFTNAESDTQDLYMEKLVSGDPTRYVTPEGSRPFDVRREVIRVKDGVDVTLEVRATRHGPVISDAYESAAAAAPDGHVMALSWAALAPDDRTLHFSVRAASARSGAELREAARDFHSPQQNIVYADDAGHIGFITAGRAPRRRPDDELRGTMPAPGWLARYDWDGFVPFEELPQLADPASGRIVTANQKLTPPDYPHWLGAEWAPPFRADRIDALLAARPRHALESFAAIQADVHSGVAEALLPRLLSLAHAALERPTADERLFLERLEHWDREMRAERLEPLLFAAWLRELARSVYADELGADFEDFWQERATFMLDVLGESGTGRRWCDDVATPDREPCAGRVVHALRGALAHLEGSFGSAWRERVWGDVHVARAEHVPLGGVPLLGRWFDVTLPSGGGNDTVNVGGYSIGDEREPFASHRAPGLRLLYDLGAPERSRFIVTPGQSGHVLSPHYRDQAQPWSEGGYLPMITRRDRVDRESEDTLRLLPSSSFD